MEPVAVMAAVAEHGQSPGPDVIEADKGGIGVQLLFMLFIHAALAGLLGAPGVWVFEPHEPGSAHPLIQLD
jgi:hypothetical protein